MCSSDLSRMFEGTVADPADRSIMNVCFVMKAEYKDLEKSFIDFASERGIVGIKGYAHSIVDWYNRYS